MGPRLTMRHDQRTHLRRLCALCAVGMLGVMVATWLHGRKQPALLRSASDVSGTKEQQPSSPITKPENRPASPTSSMVVMPLRTGITEVPANTSSERASIEVCPIDAATRLAIASGRIAVQDEPSGSILEEYDFSGQNCILIQIDPGRYTLRLAGNGYLGVEQSVIVKSQVDHIQRIVPLIRSYIVRGLVRNSEGQPQPDAYVSLFQDSRHLTVKSGPNGRFEAELLNPDIQKVYAFKPPHPIAAIGPVTIRESRDPNLEITLPDDSAVVTISGLVSDDLGNPVEDAQVKILATSIFHVPDKNHDAILQGLQEVLAKSDAKGHFSLNALPQEEGLLQIVGANGCETASERISLTGNVVKDIHLSCHPTFSIIVQADGGRDIADAVIVAESTDGRPAIQPTLEKSRYFALAYPFRILAWSFRSGQDQYGVTESEWVKSYHDPIRLVLGHARVEGLVRDEAGVPITRFSIRVHPAEVPSSRITFPFASEDGSFNLNYLPPGIMTLEVDAEIAGTDGRRTSASFSQAVALVEGQTTFLSAVLRQPQMEAEDGARRTDRARRAPCAKLPARASAQLSTAPEEALVMAGYPAGFVTAPSEQTQTWRSLTLIALWLSHIPVDWLVNVVE